MVSMLSTRTCTRGIQHSGKQGTVRALQERGGRGDWSMSRSMDGRVGESVRARPTIVRSNNNSDNNNKGVCIAETTKVRNGLRWCASRGSFAIKYRSQGGTVLTDLHICRAKGFGTKGSEKVKQQIADDPSKKEDVLVKSKDTSEESSPSNRSWPDNVEKETLGMKLDTDSQISEPGGDMEEILMRRRRRREPLSMFPSHNSNEIS